MPTRHRMISDGNGKATSVPPSNGKDRRKEIGTRLRSMRVAHGLSQEDIAEACDVTRAAVSQWEQGKALAEMDRLEAIAARLVCSVDWLRTGAGNAPSILSNPTNNAGQRRALRYVHRIDAGVAWSQHVNEPPFEGAVAEMEGGVGAGVPYSRRETVHDWWRIPPGLLHEGLRTKAHSLRAFRVRSDTAEPKIRRGDVVFIDLNQRNLFHNAVFAIDNGISIVLKRIVLDPAISKTVGLKDDENGNGPVFQIPVKKLKIVGRVIARFENL